MRPQNDVQFDAIGDETARVRRFEVNSGFLQILKHNSLLTDARTFASPASPFFELQFLSKLLAIVETNDDWRPKILILSKAAHPSTLLHLQTHIP